MIGEYLLFNLIVIALPLVSRMVVPQTRLPQTRASAIAILAVGSAFLWWDCLVHGQWWVFNPTYAVPTRICGLPLGEFAFFVTVPYACLVIWESLQQKSVIDRLDSSLRWYFAAISFGLLIVVSILVYTSWHYTASVVLLAVMLVGLDAGVKTYVLKLRTFHLFILVVIGLTLLFDGYLTSRPIVVYNDRVLSSLYIGSVPLEDVLYGIGLVGLVTIVYEWLLMKR